MKTVLAESEVKAAMAEKPRLRGVLHHWAAVCAVGAGAVLVSMAPDLKSAATGAIYAASLVVLFGISATYHRAHWSERGRARMRRLDHASIFILIAGTYTPAAVLGLPPEASTRLLSFVWGGALFGVLVSLLWVKAPKLLNAGLCVALGWVAVAYQREIRAALGNTELWLMLIGGAAYTVGAIAYATKRPNPWPGVFGYHEVFHAFTIVGAVAHFAAVILLVRASGATAS